MSEKPTVTEEELNASDGMRIPREIRREVLLRHRGGEAARLIARVLGLRRDQVRALVDPKYQAKHEKLRETRRAKSQAKVPRPRKLSHAETAVHSEREKLFDEDATKLDCMQDLNRIQAKHPLRVIGRNMYRNEGKYSDATWNRYFGTFHQFRRAARLELSRYQHEMEKKVAKHSSLDHYREFYADEVAPYLNRHPKAGESSRDVKLILSGSDFHDIECDPFALRVFIDTAERMQPDVILLNGDVYDLYEFSRYDIDPRQVKIKERFDYVREEIYSPLRTVCPNARIVFLLGNHEWRVLKHLADRTPHLKVLLADVMGLTLEDIFGVDEFEIDLVCKWDLAAFMRGDVKKQVNENYIVFYDCFVGSHIHNSDFGLSGTSGHTHRPELKVDRNLAAGRISWTTTGSMCKTGAEYVQGMDKAMKGFALFHIDPANRVVVPENILIPGDFAAVGGRYYHRQDDER